MTPEQKIKATIMLQCPQFADTLGERSVTDPAQVDELWSLFREDGPVDDLSLSWESRDYIQGFRTGTHETDLETEWSRHYESQAVAAKMFDGTWVGWTYWYGGGKHGEPAAIDWMTDAYELDCRTEEKLVVVETFTRR